MSGEACDLFAAYVPDGDMGRYARELPRRLRDDFTTSMKLPRDENFQDLLLNYPRPKRVFLVAIEPEDTVGSEYLVRDDLGKEYKPEDYLVAFGKFVEENSDKIDAIRVLLSRPRDWNTSTLVELKNKLTTAPERFTIENLQRAHELRYHKALVEIISMVKHAADAEQPLYTAPERVERAFAKVTAGKTFNDQQQKWLDRGKSHLIENLSIDQKDFDIMSIFEQAGGWRKAESGSGVRGAVEGDFAGN